MYINNAKADLIRRSIKHNNLSHLISALRLTYLDIYTERTAQDYLEITVGTAEGAIDAPTAEVTNILLKTLQKHATQINIIRPDGCKEFILDNCTIKLDYFIDGMTWLH